MKTSDKQKLFLYIFFIFTAFTIAIFFLERERERKHKIEALEEKLDAYTNIINAILIENGEWKMADFPLPEDVRLTLIGKQGQVLYDNTVKGTVPMENHAHRPEIIAAAEIGQGSDIRISTSNEKAYLYYAKRFNDYYIRVALPYNIQVRHFLKPDNLFLYYILILFAVMLTLINLVSGRFGKSIQEKTRRLKQEMTGNITHELRTPVTGIRGCLETILEHQLAPEKKQYFIESAYNQVLALSELIQDMSLITKIEEAPQSFTLEPVGMNDLLENLSRELAIPLQEKDIRMEWDFPKNIIVKGNRNLLYSIFRNLTDNVIRYAGTQIDIKVSKYDEDKDFYYFSYSDTGAGIPDEQHLSRLFERFYRINEGRTRDTGGSGLGLSIVKNAVAFHKGTIVAKNRPGGGLEFFFQLPRTS